MNVISYLWLYKNIAFLKSVFFPQILNTEKWVGKSKKISEFKEPFLWVFL